MTTSEKSPRGDGEAEATEKPQTRRTRPGASGLARGAADGRRSGEQLKRNQERLGVGADHRTEAMKKGKRGTFP